MKILFITPFYPYPLNIAGKVGLYNLLKHLKGYHDITLVSLFKPNEDTHTPTLGDYCTRVITIEKKAPDPKEGYVDYIKKISPFSMSYVLEKCYEPAVSKKISELIRSEKFDIILYRFTQSSLYMQENISIPQILIEDDILYLKAKRQSAAASWKHFVIKLINYMEYIKIRRLEKEAWASVDAIITLTESDKEKIKAVNSVANVSAIEFGIDNEYYKPGREDLKNQILFLGAAQNTLNIDAVRFFLKRIWPIILSKSPQTLFKIIGNGFGNIFDKDKLKNVEEIGFVEDTRPYFNTSKVFVVPLLNGSGYKLKVLEAMAMGCPIVITSVGCEGINLIDGKDAFIRDDALAFADAVLKLLDNSRLQQSFSDNIRKKAVKDYAWGPAVEKFNQYIKSIKKKIPACVCGSSDYKKIFLGNYNRNNFRNYYFEILKCKKCSLARTYPVPDATKLEQDPNYSFQKYIAESEKNSMWAKVVIKSVKKYKNSGNLLDIGCFSGKSLEEAEREGFGAYGVDLHPKAVEYGKKLGRNIFLGQIYDAHFEDSFFSCAIMNHVIEHIFDPVKVIKEINRVLEPNGILIVNTPAYNSIMRFVMGQNWSSWTPYTHAFFYTKNTLDSIITKNSQLKLLSLQQKGILEEGAKSKFRSVLKKSIANFAKIIDKGEQIEAVYIKG